MQFIVIQGCPVPSEQAPYVEIIVKKSKSRLNSAYRGEDAKSILHRYGKRTQAEIHRDLPNISNPAGRSTHELRSDGVAYAGPVGRHLEQWQCGFDVNDSDVAACKRVAAKYGWHLFQPYSRGVEYHHLNFRGAPHTKLRYRALVWRTKQAQKRRKVSK